MGSNITEEIARFCSEVQYNDLTENAIEKVKVAITDTYGVIFTGYHEPVSDLLVKWIKDKQGKGKSTILGYQLKTSASYAALINGTMGHAIDYDDVSFSLRGHPSVLILPVVLAVGEKRESTGEEMILAFILGTEVMVKLGRSMNPSHYLKGWHATATWGVIGAAVAAGKLYGFDKQKMKMVLGLAGSMASGMRLNFGTMTKPFHVGYAAKNGVEAAELINLGFTASNQIFDTGLSMFHLYGDEKNISIDDIQKWGKPWGIENPGFDIKLYPCCSATHRAVDAMEMIIQRERIDPNQVERIDCFAPFGSLAALLYNKPQTGLEGKFSMQYVIAAMLVDQQLKIDSFTDEKVNRKIIQQLIPKIFTKETKAIKENRDIGDLGYIQLSIQMRNGKSIEEKVYYAKGSPNKCLSKVQLHCKFSDCLKSSTIINGDKLFDQLMNLEKVEKINSLL
ncbi:MmgE/PrpD family protein [Virgibacillus byunsanensis]|uniref:MmgE/PrpD family protein n=1 Tax=Virgibacillus byunsanensis TaxID=570945 RepID=A0ABW3LMF4_9BACI